MLTYFVYFPDILHMMIYLFHLKVPMIEYLKKDEMKYSISPYLVI